MLSSNAKHLLHCLLFFIIMVAFCSEAFKYTDENYVSIDPWAEYGTFFTIFLYALRYLAAFSMPQMMANFLGLIVFNAFPDKVVLKGSPLLAPFICIRVVTRGDYPELVKKNVMRNMNTCLDTGLENFLIEVATDKPINIPKHRRIREVVVPREYKTKSGALFKARALQYCLEDNVNVLNPNDWIVHLDEETILTENSVRGITNFVLDGKYPFGQGLITYANENVVNWMTTLADSFRVTDDMGKLRFIFKVFHKPLLSWKGSFVVTQLHAERDVSFDNGPDGSVAEDCFFAMKAFSLGYSFDWIEGEMYEKSPFTLLDFLQQRKRWLQGILLVVHSKLIPFKYKIFLTISVYSWCTMFLSSLNIIFAVIFPLPCPFFIDFICTFLGGLAIYMYIFGVLKSFSLYRFGILKSMICIIGAVCTFPINLIIENAAVLWGVFTNKHKFYVVQKEVSLEARPLITV
ncbi:CLUMA_CG017208, isoform A [Clunio marinus]|uniref:CLUMA_CG017208, isoform A n=1 Tax=Clunio marinus TaxID=568069 RepID=A0A1J1IV97_9DIPT|nr:CLUMA_CG017208, isoform A [Clunio marinus]